MSLAERALDAMRICPECAGGARVPRNGDWSDPDTEMIECLRCDGYGNMLLAIEARCYTAGRDEALSEVRRGLALIGEMVQAAFPGQLNQLQLEAAAVTVGAGGLKP